MSTAVTRLHFEARDEVERRRLYATLFGFLLLVPTAAIAVIELVGRTGAFDVFSYAHYEPYLRYAVLAAYFSLFLDLVVSIFIVQRRAAQVLVLTVVSGLLLVGLSLTFVIGLHEGALGVLRASALAAAAMAVVSLVWLWRLAGRPTLSRAWLAAALAFSVPLIPQAFAQWLLQVSDRPILAHYVSSHRLADYYLGYSVAAAAGLVVHGTSRALQPVMTRDLKASLDERVVRLGTYWFGVMVLACLGVGFFGRDIVSAVAGSRFPEAARVVPVVALAYVGFAAYFVVTQGIWYSMRTRWVAALTLTAGAANVGLNLLLVPRYGIMAAAWDTVAGFAILAVLQAVLAHRLYRIDWEYGRWLKLLLAAGAAYLFAELAPHPASTLRIVLEVIAVAVVVPTALTVLRFWTPDERNVLRRRLAR